MWECNYVWNFWLAIGNFLKICGVSLPLNAKDIILGLTEHSSAQGTINNVLIILKYYIYMSADANAGLLFQKVVLNSWNMLLILKSHQWYICPQYKRNMLKENGQIWRRHWVDNIWNISIILKYIYNLKLWTSWSTFFHCNFCVLKHCVYRIMYKSVLGKINKLQLFFFIDLLAQSRSNIWRQGTVLYF